jgi:hypothetical protein
VVTGVLMEVVVEMMKVYQSYELACKLLWLSGHKYDQGARTDKFEWNLMGHYLRCDEQDPSSGFSFLGIINHEGLMATCVSLWRAQVSKGKHDEEKMQTGHN